MLQFAKASGNNDLSLYIHIPFCTKKCPYCHFYSIPCTEVLLDTYLKALLIEIDLRKEAICNSTLVSLYFGGGTPFLFSPNRLEKVLQTINSSTDIEITLEANPESVTYEGLKSYAALGINRISLGVQSFNANELAFLGRRHTPDDVVRAIDATISAGISNISIDLMYELPHQTQEAWEYSLDQATSLPITHLSLYNLMIEEPSAFFRKKEALEKAMPSPEVSKMMYEMLLTKTAEAGFMQYEISAFAKQGFASVHNQGYWLRRPFLGFGPSAFSFYEDKRFSNVSNLTEYCSKLAQKILPVDFVDSLTPHERLRELLAVGLRMNQGVHLPSFQAKWGALDKDLASTLSWLKKINLLTEEESCLKLSDTGRLLYDQIASEII